jgi:hypothetical protein
MNKFNNPLAFVGFYSWVFQRSLFVNSHWGVTHDLTGLSFPRFAGGEMLAEGRLEPFHDRLVGANVAMLCCMDI